MIWLFLLALWVDILDTHWKVVVIFQEFLLFETSFFSDFYLSLEKMGQKNVTKHINWQFFLLRFYDPFFSKVFMAIFL